MKRANNNNPLVSVVVTTKNSERTIGNCLKSIQNQTYHNLELIVVDENSTDKTLEIIKKYRPRIYSGGLERVKKRNMGIEKSRGKFVVIIDSDLELAPDLIEDCVRVIRHCDFVAIPELPFGMDFRARCHRFEKMAYLQGFSPVEGARFFPKELVQSVGGYDSDMVGAEDWDLTQRLLKKGYQMGRATAQLQHNDEKYDFLKTLQKKYYYGRVYRKYAKRHPSAFAYSIFRFPLLKNLKQFFSHPDLFLGSILFRFIEGSAVLVGAVMSRHA